MIAAAGRLAAASLTIASLALVGCAEAKFEATHIARADHVPGSAVDVRTRNGGISITADPAATEVEVTAHVRAQTAARADNVVITLQRIADGALVVGADWPGGIRDSEGVTFEVVAPDVYGVFADTKNGRITLRGVNGGAKLRTSNGAIDVRAQGGDVDARTSNGRIEAHDVGGSLVAVTSNGAVRASFARPASGPVDLVTSNGSVEIDAPAEGFGRVVLSTSNGTARIEGLRSTRVSGRVVEATLDEGGQPLKVRTSNGSVRVRLREG